MCQNSYEMIENSGIKSCFPLAKLIETAKFSALFAKRLLKLYMSEREKERRKDRRFIFPF